MSQSSRLSWVAALALVVGCGGAGQSGDEPTATATAQLGQAGGDTTVTVLGPESSDLDDSTALAMHDDHDGDDDDHGEDHDGHGGSTPPPSSGCTVWGPETFIRHVCHKDTSVRTFAKPAGSGPFTMRVDNGDASGKHRVTSGQVTLNGKVIVSRADLKKSVARIERAVTLLASNKLKVELTSRRGSFITISILGAGTGGAAVAITSPASGTLFSASPITVTGTATAGASVKVNGVTASMSGTTFTASGVTLSEGANTITATATVAGTCGGSASASVGVTLDSGAPDLSASAGLVCSGVVRVSGHATDAGGAVTVSADGAGGPVALPVAADGSFSGTVTVASGATSLTVTARDAAGNTASAALALTELTCAAADQCHGAGVCDPATLACTSPTLADGTSCDDGNVCTTGDSCQAGVCQAGAAVKCAALDQCHDAGVCNPASGVCSNPVKADGKACNDGNACTVGDSCQAGVCQGGTPIACAASDSCHDAGVCNPKTGACSNPAKPDGTSCSDGSACTIADSCQAGVCQGGTPVSCAASDQCHSAGTCDPATGICSNPVKPNGVPCSDGNLCTQTDVCSAGICVGGNPVICGTPSGCSIASVCAPSTGVCSAPGGCATCGNGVVESGETCDDGNTAANDGCSATCQTEVCGDGIVETTRRITQVEFIWLANSCLGNTSVTFSINGSPVYSAAVPGSSCGCSPGIKSTTLTSGAVLDLVAQGTNTFTIDVPDGQIAWAVARVSAMDTVYEAAMVDINGGAGARNPNLCAGFLDEVPPQSVTSSVWVSERCDDGNTTPGDGCSATCQPE